MPLRVIFILCVAMATVLTACSGGGSGGSSFFRNGNPVHFTGNPPLVPSQGIYLGAFANTGASPNEEQMLATLESQIGRTFALSMHYYGWQAPFPGGAEVSDAVNGRIPVISWNCGVPNALVASGAEDANIDAHADALRAYAGPVFVRYQWEMNLPVTANNRTACYDPKTDGPDDLFSPTEFIAAWNHIHAVFAARGVTNVAFLWNPSGGGENPNNYYPGDATVDWAGIDEYDRNNVPFPDVFSLYPLLEGHHKPILIAETGATPAFQPTFFGGAVPALQTFFPAVKGFMYFDAEGNDDWRLTPPGVAALASIAHNPYLSATP